MAGRWASAAMCWLLDARIDQSLDSALPPARDGRTRRGWPRGSVFRPVRWVGAGMVVIGVLLCFYQRTPEQLWWSRQDGAARRLHHE